MDHVNLLRQLVAVQTVNDPAKEVRPTRECPRLIEEKLTRLGLEVEVLEQNGFYSVMGAYGQGRPVTLFLAHFDVVPSGPNWVTDPFKLTIQDSMGYGRGTADDKGNIVALLLTAKAVIERSIGGTIVFAMTGDEEIGGANGATAVRQRLEQQNLFPDYLITADGVGMQIVTRRRNTCGFTIRVPRQSKSVQGTIEQNNFTTVFFGRETRHSAYFLPGVDRHALLTASSFLNHNPHLLVAQAEGAFVKSNVVPDQVEITTINPEEPPENEQPSIAYLNLTQLLQALLPLSRIHFHAHPSDYGITLVPNLLYEKNDHWEVYFDGRAMTTDTASEETAIRAVLDDKLEGIDYDLTVHMGKAFMNTPITAKLVQTAQLVAQHLDLASQPIELGGASDTRHFTDQAIEAIDFGPIGFGVHGPNEHVLLESLPKTALFYTKLVSALHTGTPD